MLLRTKLSCRSLRLLHQLPSTSCARSAARFISYDGTASSLAQSDLGREALSDNIETVELAYDKHSPPGYFHSDNPPIVFLHGLFGSKSNNKTVSRKMAIFLERDVYCLDLRNHGDSPHSERMDYPALSADVERFIGEHKLEQPILIGHSMGAKTAMAVCLRKPKLCSLLVPVDNAPVDLTGGGAGFSKFGTYVKQMEKIDGNHKLTSLKDCDKILAEVEPNKTIRQFLLTNMKPDDEGGYRCRVPLDIMEKTLDNISAWPFNYEISRWNGPALFVRGTKSPYLADEYLESVAKFFPRFEIRDVESGHWVTSENPSAFVGAVSEWIRYQESD